MQAHCTEALGAGITAEQLLALDQLADTLEENLVRMGRTEEIVC